jgi:hypothetical protein
VLSRPGRETRIIGRKESVRTTNRTPAPDVDIDVAHGPIAAGEVVYLLAELAADDRIHEIGTSARVVAAEGPSVTLELGGARDKVSCPREHVARAQEQRARERDRRRPPLRAATA